MNFDRINPIKRDEVRRIAESKEINKYFDSIKVFGSSIRENCREDSDLDLFVTIKKEFENNEDIITEAYMFLSRFDWTAKDIFFAHEQTGEINKSLYQNMVNGVEILR